MNLKPLGLILTATALAVPLYWMVPLAPAHDTIALFSQYLGVSALIAMALTQVIATRLGFVERIFGGMDRSYILHKWLGIGALAAILLHDTIDAEMDGLGRESILVEVAETAGELGLYGILILVVISVATFIPYHLWYWTHKIMGTLFAMGAFHFLFILKPFENSDPLGLYVTAFCLLGLLSYAYKLAPRWMHAKRRYLVSDIDQAGHNTIVSLSPSGRPMRYRAGQFAFVSFDQPGLGEPHPFTISKAPDETGALRFSIAPIGDFTANTIRKLQTGTQAKIEGPYGRFARSKGDAPEIWFAAGVGITPFISWAQELGESDDVTLFYCVKDAASASHLDELREIQGRLGNFKMVVHESKVDGRLSANEIVGQVGSEIADTHVYFCGPKPMREQIYKGLVAVGLSARWFHYEEFEIRTGIGLRRLALWVLQRTVNKTS